MHDLHYTNLAIGVRANNLAFLFNSTFLLQGKWVEAADLSAHLLDMTKWSSVYDLRVSTKQDNYSS